MDLTERKIKLQKEIDVSKKMIRKNISSFQPLGYIFKRKPSNSKDSSRSSIFSFLHQIPWFDSFQKVINVILK